MAHILIIGALPESLVNFRGDFIRSLITAGHRVTAMAASTGLDQIKAIESLGAHFLSYPVARNGMNPWRDIQTIVSLCNAFYRLKPDVVFAYTIKPVVWGGVAAFVTQVPSFFALIEGLGYMFQGGRRLAAALATNLYRVSLARSKKVIFLNPDNKLYFLSRNIIQANKAALIDGIGLDLTWYESAKLPEGAPVFLCIARLLGEKGLREYAEAAHQVKLRYPEAVFNLVGPQDPSPDGIPLMEVNAWHAESKIQYLGEVRDVRPLIADCHVYVLPSYHEGMPRTVLEAMAIGRPILTTDVPGCRETVVAGENGYLVPKMDVAALVERMIWFIENRDHWTRMGQASRRMAENRFDVHKINAELLRLMGLSAYAA